MSDDDALIYGPPIAPVTVTDANIHMLAMHIRSWMPGEHLQATVERALRQAVHAVFAKAGDAQ